MIKNNYYPVKFTDFLRIKSNGNYIVNYAILDDRVHFEMAVENSVFVTQKFKENIYDEIDQKAQNYASDRIAIFLKMTLSNTTFYRYYPTIDMIKELKNIKLYDKIIVTEIKKGEYRKEDLKIFETDTYMKAMDGDEVIIFGEKDVS